MGIEGKSLVLKSRIGKYDISVFNLLINIKKINQNVFLDWNLYFYVTNQNINHVMNYKNLVPRVLSITFIFALFTGFSAIAQQAMPPQMEVREDFSDDEFKEFVKINLVLIPLQEKSQGDMVKAIEENDLDIERFQELAQAQQAGTLTEVSNDAQEMANFNMAGQKVMEMQQVLQTDIMKAITDSELSEQKFQEMYTSYTQSEKVKTKVDSMIEKELK